MVATVVVTKPFTDQASVQLDSSGRLTTSGGFVQYDVKVDSARGSHVARPRNPRFKDAHAGTKRRLKAKTINRDSGISGTACCYYLL
jgi:hypothetical protein